MEIAFSKNEPVITHSEQETRELGCIVGRRLMPGDVVALYGTLGAGKTQFVKGVCSELGISPEHVTSPTFTLINEYTADRCPVYHFDAYRVEQISEFYELGYETYFYGDGICLVEWPDRIESLLPAEVIRIQFTHRPDNERQITLLEG